MIDVVLNAKTELTLTERAVTRIALLMEREGNDALMLRISIGGGGCSGFQYEFSFDDTVTEDDKCFERSGVTLVADAISLPYLSGAEIDFIEDLSGSQFVVQNPNASGTCGCGTSFSV